MPTLRTRNERDRALRDTFEEIDEISGPAFWVVVCVLLVAMFIAWATTSGHNQQQDALVGAQSLFSQDNTAGNKEIANAVLLLDSLESDTVISATADDGVAAEITSMMQAVSSSGQYPSYTAEYQSTWATLLRWVLEMLPYLVALSMLLIFCTYGIYTANREHYLADLDYRSHKTYVLLATTLLPIGWLFFAVSAVRYSIARRNPANVPALEVEDDEWRGDDHLERAMHAAWDIDDDDRPSRFSRTVVFNHEPGVARETYVTRRTSLMAGKFERMIRDIDLRIESIHYDLERAGERIQTSQQELNAARAQKRELTDAQASRTEDVDATSANNEFDALLAYEGVKAVRVVNGNLSILVEPVIHYKGNDYDGGSWELILDDMRLGSREIDTGVRKSWRRMHGTGVYPDYLYHSDSFCFGGRAYEINDHVSRGQYLEAVAIAVNCMASVNKEDRYKIPDALKRYKERTVLAP